MIKFDCHAHVYDRLRPVAGARYVSDQPAPRARRLALQKDHGLRGTDRCVWGSDWPHTRHEGVARYEGALRDIAERIDDAEAALQRYAIEAD